MSRLRRGAGASIYADLDCAAWRKVTQVRICDCGSVSGAFSAVKRRLRQMSQKCQLWGEQLKHRHSRKHMKMRIVLMLAGFVALLLLLYQGGRWLELRNANPEVRGDRLQRYAYGDTIEVDGVQYRRKSQLTSILLMGIDREGELVSNSYRNGGQADFLRMLVIDGEKETVSQVEIDRDTMAAITILGVLGNQSGVRTAQICLSHGFGDGGEQSCELTVQAVSNLLLGTQIDHYISMNLDGISVMNDWVGGVTVTLEDDFSHLDPEMTQGKTLTLVGDQAEIYVRSRRSVGVGTNEARMSRQQSYISELTNLLEDKIGEQKEEIGSLYDVMQPYLITDMTRGRLINELWAAHTYQQEPLTKLEGEYEIGADGFMQFMADESALKDMVLDLFYEEVK